MTGDPRPITDLVLLVAASADEDPPAWLVPGALYHHAELLEWATANAEWSLTWTGRDAPLPGPPVGLDVVRVFELTRTPRA